MKSNIRLREIDADSKNRTWESDSKLRIGRLESLEITVNDSSVSRHHAEIYATPRGWRVRDLQSTNGTFLNGRPIGRRERGTNPGPSPAGPEEYPLHDGDELLLGPIP